MEGNVNFDLSCEFSNFKYFEMIIFLRIGEERRGDLVLDDSLRTRKKDAAKAAYLRPRRMSSSVYYDVTYTISVILFIHRYVSARDVAGIALSAFATAARTRCLLKFYVRAIIFYILPPP